MELNIGVYQLVLPKAIAQRHDSHDNNRPRFNARPRLENIGVNSILLVPIELFLEIH